MTRKEEINQSASTYVDGWYKERDMNPDAYPMDAQISKKDFIAGAEWADKTMIDKACEWLKFNNENGGCSHDNWEKDFRKYMKE